MMGLRRKEFGPSAAVHEAHYKNQSASDNWILVIENVPEYEERVVRTSLKPANLWSITHVKLDPRLLGLGTARARVFYVCWRKDKLQWNAPFGSLMSFVECLRARVTLSAMDYLYMQLPKSVLTPSQDTRNKCSSIQI